MPAANIKRSRRKAPNRMPPLRLVVTGAFCATLPPVAGQTVLSAPGETCRGLSIAVRVFQSAFQQGAVCTLYCNRV